jgi:hypothetical protein
VVDVDEANDNKKKHPNWGGRRQGAGAPKGNLNGLKHGRFSRRQAELVQLLMENPQTRDSLIALSKRNRARRKQAEEGAGVLLLTLLEKAAALALTPSPGPPVADIPLPEGEGHLSSPLPASGEGPAIRPVRGVRDVQGDNNRDFLDFLNAATTQIRTLLEKQSRKRRMPIKKSERHVEA